MCSNNYLNQRARYLQQKPTGVSFVKEGLRTSTKYEDENKNGRVKFTAAPQNCRWGIVESFLHRFAIHPCENYQIINDKEPFFYWPKNCNTFDSTFFMKNLLYALRNKADFNLQNYTATKDRPLGFQIAVATIFTIDVAAFITFCIIKFVSQ